MLYCGGLKADEDGDFGRGGRVPSSVAQVAASLGAPSHVVDPVEGLTALQAGEDVLDAGVVETAEVEAEDVRTGVADDVEIIAQQVIGGLNHTGRVVGLMTR